jgi:hypothetical protein
MVDKKILIQKLREASMAGANCIQLHRLDLTLCLLKWLCIRKERPSPVAPRMVVHIGPSQNSAI